MMAYGKPLGGHSRSLLATLVAILVLAAVSGCGVPPSSEATRCENLRNLRLDHIALVAVRTVPAGREIQWKTALIGIPFIKVPPSCRITAISTPTPDSRINIEIWMPLDRWNGRFQGIGNGGFAGSIDTLTLALVLGKGYVGAATDTGHESSDRDGSWALGHIEKLRDYGYRAIHETAVLSKVLIAAVYGKPATHSYFVGGSNGGREGLMEAQRFPEDYDGIIAGCPALDPTDTIPLWAWTQQRLLEDPGAYIPANKLDAVAAAVVAKCDAQDGVRDGILDNPAACQFDPAVLACRGTESERCLTAPQVQALHQIYSGPPQSVATDPLWGFQPGGELGGLGWKDWLTGARPEESIEYHYSLEFYRYMVYDDPQWTLSQFQLARDRDAVRRRLGPIMDATSADLTKFKARGGKLILFHGWNDPALPAAMTPDYYRRVQEQMGPEQSSDFVRLYMVPGMQHCFGGPGPNAFGQVPPAGDADPRHNISAALEHWVETGKPPSEIIAAKYENDLKALIAPDSSQPLRTRPICAYPQVARWTGTGSTDIAENFTCVSPGP
jgi:hypothetical protein